MSTSVDLGWRTPYSSLLISILVSEGRGMHRVQYHPVRSISPHGNSEDRCHRSCEPEQRRTIFSVVPAAIVNHGNPKLDSSSSTKMCPDEFFWFCHRIWLMRFFHVVSVINPTSDDQLDESEHMRARRAMISRRWLLCINQCRWRRVVSDAVV